MTDNERSRSIDTDTLIGHLMDQTAGVVEVDRESLARRKEQLLHMLGEPADDTPAPWEDTPAPPATEQAVQTAPPERGCVPDRGGSCVRHAGFQDDGLPAGSQWPSACHPCRPVFPRP